MPDDIFDRVAKDSDPQHAKVPQGDIFDRVAASSHLTPEVTPKQRTTHSKPLDFLAGAGSGFAKTMMATVTPGINEAINPNSLSRRLLSRFKPGVTLPSDQPYREVTTPPSTTAGKFGHGLEQAAEYIIPVGGARLARGIDRIGMEGLKSAAITGIQSDNDPGSMAIGGVAGAAGAGIAEGLPKLGKFARSGSVRTYQSALDPGTKANKVIAEKIVPQLLSRRFSAFTREGLVGKVEENLDKATQGLNTAMDEVHAAIKAKGLQNGSPREAGISMDKINAAMEQYADSFKDPEGQVWNQTAYKQAKKVQALFTQKGPEVSFDSLRKIRQLLDDSVAAVKGHQLTPKASTLARAQLHGANAIRQALASEFPETSFAKANAEYSFWKSMDGILRDATLRRVGASPGFMERLAPIELLIHGEPMSALVAKGLFKLTKSSGFKSVSAVQLDRLSKLLMADRTQDAIKLITQLTRQATRGQVGQPAPVEAVSH